MHLNTGMAIALILTILPVMLIFSLLVAVSGELTAVAAVGFVALVGLVGVVFVALIRSVSRMQPSETVDEEQRHAREERQHAREEQQHDRDVELVELGRGQRAHEAEESRTRWQDDGGAGAHRDM